MTTARCAACGILDCRGEVMPLFQLRQSHELLLRTINAGRNQTGAPADSNAGITRRTLLWGAGATAAAVSYEFNDLEVLATDDQIDVHLRGLTWTVARSNFGRNAQLAYVNRDGAHRILISHAVWPGSDRQIDVDATIQNFLGEWRLNFTAKGLGHFTIPFLHWLEGRRCTTDLTEASFSILLGEHGELSLRGPARWSVTPDWVWTVEGDLLAADGSQTLSLQCTEFTVQTKTADFLRNKVSLLAKAQGPVTVITLRTPRLSPIRISDGGADTALALRIDFKILDRSEIVVFENSARSAVALLSSNDAEFVGGTDLTGDPTIRIGLEKAALFADMGAKDRELLFGAQVGRYNQAINLGDSAAIVAGDPGEPLLIDLSRARPNGISLKLLLRELSVPVSGADMATLSFADRLVTLSFGRGRSVSPPEIAQAGHRSEQGMVEYVALRPPPGAPPPDSGAPDEILIWRDSGSGGETCADISVDLEGSRLRLFRARDLLNISFGFHNLRLECGKNGGRIVPHLVTADGDLQSQRYLLLVYFPPQHIFEMAFGDTDPFPTRQDGAVEARLSAPSRIVFDLLGRRPPPVPPDAKPDPINLTVAELTKWRNYGLAVHKRAQVSTVPLSRQLDIAGVVEGQSRSDAFAGICRSLTPPNDLQTSIEPAYRMVVSPPKDAIWSTPVEPSHSRPGMNGDYLLWHASLDPDQGGKDLRVLWARGVDLGFLYGNDPNDDGNWNIPWTEPWPPPATPPATPRQFHASLRAGQRRELMMLSSVYGLPANKDPRYAVPAPPGLTWIVNDPQDQIYEGILVPKPLQQANLTLTSIGGSFVAVGVWTPPSPIGTQSNPLPCCTAGANAGAIRPRPATFPNPQPNWGPAVNLERLRYFSYLASDIYVEVNEKYFSFPYGQKATVLQITRREFWPDPLTNETTAYLRQRWFLVFDDPVKTYPAPNQADQARGIPINTLTMVTQRTPEILDPTSSIARLDNDCGSNIIFRPIIAAPDANDSPRDVMFEYQINSDTTSAVSPLIFVNNSAVHNADLMQALVLTYNSAATDPPQNCMKQIPDQFRTVGHGGARRQYADSLKAGDTTFETLTWRLSATGRDPQTSGNCTGANCYIMNTPMECADQPGFYPLLDTAYIRVQSLDRFLGSSAGPVEVQMNRGFVKFGFDTGKNPSEIFLDVLSPAVHLDLSSDGSKSGGVAKPNARVVALSRKVGLVGGRPSATDPSQNSVAARRALRKARPPVPHGVTAKAQAQADDYAPDGATAAMAGQFDAAEFFGGALSDARLLGLVSLKDILKVVLMEAAPQLVETVAYALDGTGAFTDVRRALLDGLNGLATNIGLFESAANSKIQIGNLTWRDLYPNLASSLAAFCDNSDSQLRTMIAVLDSATSFADPKLLPATNNLVSGGNAVLAAIDAIAKNPVPPVVQDEIATIVAAWNQLRSLGVTDIQTAIINVVRDQVLKAINDQIIAFGSALCQGATAELTLLLGIDPAQCSQPLDAKTILLNVGDALFDETFAAPFVQAAMQLNSAVATVTGSINTIQAAAQAGTEQLANVVFTLAASAATSCLAAGELADISQAAQASCTQIFNVVRDLAVLPFANAAALQTAISSYEKTLDALDTDPALPAAAKQALQPLRNAARTTLNEAADVLVRLGTARNTAAQLNGVCNFTSLKPIQDVFYLRRDATIRVKDLVQNVGSMIETVAGVAGGNSGLQIGTTLAGLSQASADLIREVTSISDLTSTPQSPVWGELTTLASQLPSNSSYAADVSFAQQAAQTQANNLNTYMRTSLGNLQQIATIAVAQNSIGDLMTQAASVVAFSTDFDRRLAALVAQGTQLPAQVLTALDNLAAKALLPAVQFAIQFYQPCVDALNTISSELTTLANLLGQATDTTSGASMSMVPPEVVDAIHTAQTNVQQELSQLQSIATGLKLDPSGNAVPANVAQAVATARTLLANWKQNQPAIVLAVKNFKDFADMLLRGNFSALIDLSALRQQILDGISQFAPTTVDLNYTFATAVEDFPGPSGDDQALFYIREHGQDADLTLSANVHINLLNNQRTVNASGALQPFNIFLIPGFEALTLQMSKAEFGSTGPSDSHFDVTIEKIIVGPYLEFIQELTAYLGSGNATGPYYEISLAPPSIEVGYRYSKPVLSLVAITFINVGFSISALLPIDNRSALFKLSLADQYDPFMITVLPCYGGGGFIAFTGNPKGIVSIEASFEFGAVVAYGFGPLSAEGQVTAGIYILRSADGSGLIRGFVHAMGEGNLACFSICVNIEVWVQMELPGGNVTGGAHFEFSFKVAFAEVSYGFDASYTFAGGAGSSERLLPGAFRTQTRVPKKSDQWLDYRKMYGARAA
jgi:hypothetical protein